MSLSLREKQSLYHSLGQLLRSGVPLPGALTSLANTSRGSQRQLLRRVNDGINAGLSLSDALAKQRPTVGDLEIGLAAGGEKSGRLEVGMVQLSQYFGALGAAREGILKKCAYPLFVLHFGVFLLALPTLLFGAGLRAYLEKTVGVLLLAYGIALVIWLALSLVRDVAANNSLVDGLLRFVPIIGKLRRAFATSRFCAVYGMQLDAGINVFSALEGAQRASGSGLVKAAVQRAIPSVRSEGAQVGPLLAASGAFPEPATRAICIGEQTGELVQELTRLAADYQAEALARVDTAAEWGPRIFHILTLLYVGYVVVIGYQKYLQMALSIGDVN